VIPVIRRVECLRSELLAYFHQPTSGQATPAAHQREGINLCIRTFLMLSDCS
jgi:hypothetical protein